MSALNPAIGHHRLKQQRISQDQFAHPEEVVCWMGAMQAQDYGQALWAVAARMQKPSLAAVEGAIAEGKIICTWTMRGTIHFTSPENVLWMLKHFASRVLKSSGRRLAELNLDEATLHRCREICQASLEGGKCLTRPQVLEAIEAAGISTEKQRGYHILSQLAQEGLICQGPHQDKQQTFVLLQEWAPSAEDLDLEAAFAKLARVYFASHGPATAYDLAWWVGATLADVRRGIAAAGDDLHSEIIEGQTYYTSKSSEAPPQGPSVYLLAGYDEYILGYKDRGAVLAEGDLDRVVPGNNGVFYPMIVVDGQIAGTWKRALKKERVEVSLSPFMPLRASQIEAATAQAKSYAAFHGLLLDLQIVD